VVDPYLVRHKAAAMRKLFFRSSLFVSGVCGRSRAYTPVAPNTNAGGKDKPEGREKNRRTGFKVLGK
jgi:hypothetical protein